MAGEATAEGGNTELAPTTLIAGAAEVSRDTTQKPAGGEQTPEAKAAAEKASTEAAAKAVEDGKAEDAKLQEDLKSTDAAVKAAAEKRVAEKAEDAKLQEDLKSADPKVKEAAEKKLAEKAEAAKKAAEGAPEKYEAFKVPDGVKLEAADVTNFEALAKELNLSQAKAQKIIDLASAREVARTKVQVENWVNTVKGWQKATQEDKEIGGTKENLDKHLGHAKAGLKEFSTPEFDRLIEDYRLGDNPHFVRAWSKVGQAISEDAPHFGKAGGGSGERPAHEVMFGKTTPGPTA